MKMSPSKIARSRAVVVAAALLLLGGSLVAVAQNPATGQQGQKALPPKYDEADLKKRYEAFLLELDYVKVATDYPKAVKDLLSGNSARQVAAVQILGDTGEVAVIPWLVPLLDSEDPSLRIWAGGSLDKVISACALKRRDRTQPDRIALRPPGPGELDLRPLAWIALRMFHQPDDGNTHAYAASITRYLEAREFEGELRRCLQSRHPAVSEKAKWALQSLGFEVADNQAQTAPANVLQSPPPPRAEPDRDHTQWVEICLKDFESIRAGMTRA